MQKPGCASISVQAAERLDTDGVVCTEKQAISVHQVSARDRATIADLAFVTLRGRQVIRKLPASEACPLL